MKAIITNLLLVSLLGASIIATAESGTQPIGRYVSLSMAPQAAQRDLLAQTFDVRFPYEINTIGAAIQYLLNDSGYQLVPEVALDHPASQLLTLPLPDVDRHLGPMTLLAGLQTLIGEPFQVVIDPVHRLIAFRLKATFQSQYGEI